MSIEKEGLKKSVITSYIAVDNNGKEIQGVLVGSDATTATLKTARGLKQVSKAGVVPVLD